jgi:hypothetical protein
LFSNTFRHAGEAVARKYVVKGGGGGGGAAPQTTCDWRDC